MYFTTITPHLICILACLVSAFCQVPKQRHLDPLVMSNRNNRTEDNMIESINNNDQFSKIWQNFKRVCYFRMDPNTQMEVKHIDGNLCSHIIFAFCRLDSDGNIILGANSDEPYLKQIGQLKGAYPHLRVLVSLYNEQEFQGFVKASKSAAIRER